MTEPTIDERIEEWNEAYPGDWKMVKLMVSESGEMHAIGGYREGEGDAPFTGLERIKTKLEALSAENDALKKDVEDLQEALNMGGER